MFHKMPIVLAAIIISIVLLDNVMPHEVKQWLYSISLSIKAVIVLVLPFIIFGLLFKSVVTLSKSASKVIGIILVLTCCSNFFTTFLSHYVGMWVYHFDLSLIVPTESLQLEALWALDLPKLIANDKAMFSGIILGLIVSRLYKTKAALIASQVEKQIGRLLKIITYLIPPFVAGFVVKLQCEGVIGVMIKDYALVFSIIAFAQFGYIALAYFLLSKGRLPSCLSSIKNMLPAAISGFSSMSSAASMPLTIIGAENNAKNKDIARSVIPMTVNIHLVGDCIAIPVLAFAVLKGFGAEEPSLANYLTFSLYFVLAKFSVAAIPGGGILVMLPILESYLGFNAGMMSLITALYILFDPVITCANVLGNGAFAKMIDLCMGALLKTKPPATVPTNH